MAGAAEVQVQAQEAMNKVLKAPLTKAPVQPRPFSAAASGEAGQGTFSSMADLKTKYPDLYEGILQFSALQIVNQAKHANERFIQTLKEGQRH